MPNRTLHRFRPVQALPRAGLRLFSPRYITPADWRFAIYTAAGLAVLGVCLAVTALPADCAGQCLAAVLR